MLIITTIQIYNLVSYVLSDAYNVVIRTFALFVKNVLKNINLAYVLSSQSGLCLKCPGNCKSCNETLACL